MQRQTNPDELRVLNMHIAFAGCTFPSIHRGVGFNGGIAHGSVPLEHCFASATASGPLPRSGQGVHCSFFSTPPIARNYQIIFDYQWTIRCRRRNQTWSILRIGIGFAGRRSRSAAAMGKRQIAVDHKIIDVREYICDYQEVLFVVWSLSL